MWPKMQTDILYWARPTENASWFYLQLLTQLPCLGKNYRTQEENKLFSLKVMPAKSWDIGKEIFNINFRGFWF